MTDILAKPISGGDAKEAITKAVEGAAVYHCIPDFFSKQERDSQVRRVSLYRELWDAYYGTVSPIDMSEDETARANMCRVIVHKSNDWLFGKPWVPVPVPGNEHIGQMVQEVLDDNDYQLMSMLCGHSGAVTGDAYMTVTMDKTGEISLGWIQAGAVHPIIDARRNGVVKGALIQYPVGVVDQPDGAVIIHSASLSPDISASRTALFSQYITADRIDTYLDQERVSSEENSIGSPGIFHAQNILTAGTWSGESDLEDLWPMNRNINRVLTVVSSIVKYTAEPTTIVTGARMESIEHGEGNVLSILNPDSKVYNLETDGKMGGAGDHLARLQKLACMLSSTPEASLGQITGSLTNVKAAAMEMLTMPLVEKTRRKRITYGKMLERVCSMIARLIVAREPSVLRKCKDKQRFDRFTISFGDPLPRDEREILDNLILKLNNKLESQAGALRELGVRDPQTKAIEIIGDARMEMLTALELKKAVAGAVPNLAAFHTGSLGMSVSDKGLMKDEIAIMDEVESAVEKSMPEPEPVAEKPAPKTKLSTESVARKEAK